MSESQPIAQRTGDVALNRRRRWGRHPRRLIGMLVTLCALVGAFAARPFVYGSYYLHRGAQALKAIDLASPELADLNTSIQDLERAAQFLPGDPTPLRHLAQAYSLNGQHEAAVVALEQAYRLQPSSLLIRQELAIAYDAADQPDMAAKLGAEIGYTAERMAMIGDSYLEVGSYERAVRWYDAALTRDPDLAPGLAFRQLVAFIAVGDARAPEALRTALAAMPGLRVIQLGEAPVTVPGAELRGVQHFDATMTYGSPLNLPYGGDTGVFYWNGRATLIVTALTPGRYKGHLVARSTVPLPVELAYGVNGVQLDQIALTNGDNDLELIDFYLNLDSGLNSFDLWFLNDGFVNGADRNAEIVQIGLALER